MSDYLGDIQEPHGLPGNGMERPARGVWREDPPRSPSALRTQENAAGGTTRQPALREQQAEQRLRLFVAAEVPTNHLRRIDEALTQLHRELRGARWVGLEGQHVTLKFLGSTASSQLQAVRKVCEVVAGAHAAGQVRIRAMGAFPSSRRARVLWVGIEDPAGLLAGLSADLEGGFEPLGYAAEKRQFTPHLTVARLKSPIRLRVELPEIPAGELAPFSIDRIRLYRSYLSPHGARYELLEEFPLRPGESPDSLGRRPSSDR
jgi:RNA 2',3'-cyclic 3'-phosphodiesterase